MELTTKQAHLRIAGTLSCSLINGYGIRYVIFCQGCNHRCKGCQNPDTWSFDGGYDISIQDLIADIRKHPHIDGITLSGGDPFYQQESCIELIKALPENLDVWIYTGFVYEEIANSKLATLADYIVDGPFDISKKVEGEYFGSGNQRIIKIKKS